MSKNNVTREKRNSTAQLFREAYGLSLDPYAEDEDFFSYEEIDENDGYSVAVNASQCG